MTRVELTCDTCKRTTTVLVGECVDDRIEFWGSAVRQAFSLEGLRMPDGWRYYLADEETGRIALLCNTCPKEPHPHG
jgi:hypothetical protein